MNNTSQYRHIAKMAARSVVIYHNEPEIHDLNERLILSAHQVDFFDDDKKMLILCLAEYRKLNGQILGGYVTKHRNRGKKALHDGN